MTDLGPVLGVPGVRASVSGRADGNLGFTRAPDAEAVRAARRRFLAAAGHDPEAAVAVLQVHGARILRAGPGDRGRGALDPAGLLGEADGIVTTERGLPLLVLSADCGVVALAPRRGGAAGVVHAGWRGTLAGAPAAAAAALASASGAPPADLRAAPGPAIGPCCYEVGEEVRAAFRERRGAAAEAWFREGPRGRPHLDLPAAIRAGLREAGIPEAAIAGPGPCTLCGEGWFSHRRGDPGRQALVVAVA